MGLHYVSMESRTINVDQVNCALDSEKFSAYDVIIIDGSYRFEMIPIAIRLMAEDGIIICDNSEGYFFYEAFKETALNRVDFFGNGPCGVLPWCTSVYFNSSAFIFSSKYVIPDIATN